MHAILPWIPILPLLAAIACGLAGKQMGRNGAAIVANAAVAISFVLSAVVAWDHFSNGTVINQDWYIWAQVGELTLKIGFLIDGLTAVMLLVVTFVSFMVHIYTIGYMHDDPGFQRFFAYIALFTFSMLMLVMSNNFLQLFFGWEAVGLVSYLLIGFWYEKPTAIFANLKAFLVNRVGDFGFIVGIGLVLAYFGSLDYAEVFANRESISGKTLELIPGIAWSSITMLCLALFVGAMGKSAQFPLHVWLPDSMEGPTPISALIHAATMVTAGIFMVARMAPLFELSATALTTVMVIGGITAFFMALLGLVQHDIKRVVAYSTLSQLGYMTAALGASAYSAAIFHLTTHAFFKALLFLGAGAVIVALHHKQDMREMGGLRKRMPITFVTMVIGSIALCGVPPLAGFFSKDMIIIAVGLTGTTAGTVVEYALMAAAFITSFYSFRLLVLVFGGETRMSTKDFNHVKDCNWTITVPLVLLAIPSIFAGMLLLQPLMEGVWYVNFPGSETINASSYAAALTEKYPSAWSLIAHAYASPVFYIAIAGVAAALYIYLMVPLMPKSLASNFGPFYRILLNKYGIDDFNNFFFAGGMRGLGGLLWRKFDMLVIDGSVNGAAAIVQASARKIRGIQSGRIYHYAFAMIISLAILLPWLASR